MPKQRMTVKQILNLSPAEVSKLTAAELKPLVATLTSAANKRLKRLEKSGIESPAYQSARRSILAPVEINANVKPRFSTRMENVQTKTDERNQLQKKFAQARYFLNLKTSTVTGAKSTFEMQAQKAIDDYGISDAELLKNVWKAYSRTAEINPGLVSALGSPPKVVNEIITRLGSGNKSVNLSDVDALTAFALNTEQDMYASQQEGADYAQGFNFGRNP